MPRYPYRDLGTRLGRDFRNNLNANFDDIEADLRDIQSDLDAKESRITQIENDSIERDNDLDARIDNIVANAGSSNTEIVDARYDSVNNVTYPTLKDRLDSHSNEIGILQRKTKWINVKEDFGAIGDGLSHPLSERYTTLAEAQQKYPHATSLSDEIDWCAIQGAINSISSDGIIFIPKGTYKLSAIIRIDQKNSVSLIGECTPYFDGTALQDGVILRDYGIVIGKYNPAGNAKNITIKNLGVYCPAQANGIEIQANTDGVTIENCVSIARDHSYLAQSYTGTVKNITVSNCKSYNSTHGFIFKCQNVYVKNCYAEGHATNGFGAISDNIVGPTNTAICRWVTFDSCFAESCAFGFNFYSRDMFSDTNANNLRCSDITLTNCKTLDCNIGYHLGDDATSVPAGTTYNNVFGIVLNNCIENNSYTNSIVLGRSKDCSIQAYVEKPIGKSGFEKNIKINLTSYIQNLNHSAVYQIQGTTPNVSSVLRTPIITFITNNASQTVINDLPGLNQGDLALVKIDENNTIIRNSANISLKITEYKNKGSWVLFRKTDDGKLTEVAGYYNNTTPKYKDLVNDNTPLDLYVASAFDVQISTSTTNKISVQNSLLNSSILTIIIRPTVVGTYSFGGFDTTQFVVPSGFPTSITFGNAIVSNWIYLPGLTKWICVSYTTSPIQ